MAVQVVETVLCDMCGGKDAEPCRVATQTSPGRTLRVDLCSKCAAPLLLIVEAAERAAAAQSGASRGSRIDSEDFWDSVPLLR